MQQCHPCVHENLSVGSIPILAHARICRWNHFPWKSCKVKSACIFLKATQYNFTERLADCQIDLIHRNYKNQLSKTRLSSSRATCRSRKQTEDICALGHLRNAKRCCFRASSSGHQYPQSCHCKPLAQCDSAWQLKRKWGDATCAP